MDKETLDLIQLLLTAGVIPAALFAFQMKASIDKMSCLMVDQKEADDKAHQEILNRFAKMEDKFEHYEKNNEDDHKDMLNLINEIDKRNQVEHAVLANGRIIQH